MCMRLDVAVIGSTTVRSTTGRSTSDRGAQSSPGRISGTVRSTRVTTVRVGTTVRGFNSAASSSASCLDRPWNRGSTSARFSSVATEARTAAVVKHSFPSRIGSSTSGNRWTSQAAARR